MVKKGCDHRCLLAHRLSLWEDEQFDILLQEAVHCNQSFQNSYRSVSGTPDDHLVRVFTKLMQKGDIRAAVSWLTEHAGGGVLKCSDMTELSLPGSGKTSMSVLDALRFKHLGPVIPPTTILSSLDHLPQLEDLDITGVHNQFACGLLASGGAGTGGCDASLWHDILLRYGTSSARLCYFGCCSSAFV